MKDECSCWIQSTGRCMADICGALHCDLMLEPMIRKTKCNPAAAARNRHLCEVIFEQCLSSVIPNFFSVINLIILCRVWPIVVFLSMRVHQQAVFMVIFSVFWCVHVDMLLSTLQNTLFNYIELQNSSCASSAMPTLALGNRNPYRKDTG